MFGNKNGEIRISALLMGERVAVHCLEPRIIFRHHETVRIHTERAYPVIKGTGEIHQFRFVTDLCDRFIHFCGRFHTDTDVHRI